MATSTIKQQNAVEKKTFIFSNITVEGNNHYDIDVDISDGISGYTPIAIAGWQINGAPQIALNYAIIISNTLLRMRVLNTASSSITIADSAVIVLYAK